MPLTASVIHAFAGLTNVVEGRIAAPFGTDTYTFTLSQTKTFVIDGLTDDDAFSVTLTGPNGLSITRNIARSDSFEIGGNDAFTAGPGNYTMVVNAISGNIPTGRIGSFGFRLLDLSTATPMSLNTPVNFTLPAGFATQAFSFTGNAGDQLIFDSLALPVSTDEVSIRIIDPLGRLLTGPLSYSVETGIPALPVTGTYILLIEGRTLYDRNGPLQLGFALDRAVTNPFTLQIGAPNPKPGPLWGAGLTAGHGLTFTGADEVTVPDNSVTAQTNSFTIEAMVKLTRFDGYTPIATKVAAAGSSGGGTRAYGTVRELGRLDRCHHARQFGRRGGPQRRRSGRVEHVGRPRDGGGPHIRHFRSIAEWGGGRQPRRSPHHAERHVRWPIGHRGHRRVGLRLWAARGRAAVYTNVVGGADPGRDRGRYRDPAGGQ